MPFRAVLDDLTWVGAGRWHRWGGGAWGPGPGTWAGLGCGWASWLIVPWSRAGQDGWGGGVSNIRTEVCGAGSDSTYAACMKCVALEARVAAAG
jgi:hypothetical protein